MQHTCIVPLESQHPSKIMVQTCTSSGYEVVDPLRKLDLLVTELIRLSVALFDLLRNLCIFSAQSVA